MKNKKIKIIFVLPHLKAGGAERVVSFLFMQMDKSIYDLNLLVLGSRKDNHYKVQENNVHYLNIDRLRGSFVGIIKFLRKNKPDIVFSSIGHINIYFGLIKTFFPRVKFIAREASIYSSVRKFHKRPNLPKIITKNCYQKLDAIIYQSEDMRKDFEQVFSISSHKGILIQNPITLIPNPVIKSEIKNTPKTFKFIIVGSLIESKGHLRVFQSLKKLNFDFTLEIIGEGPLKKALKDQVTLLGMNDQIHFRGLEKDMNKVYASADFLIQTSYFEGFPNAVLEALSFGVPCIIFEAPGGHKEMISEGMNGFIISNENNAEVVIEKTTLHDWDRVEIQSDVLSRFGSKIIIKQYDRLFQNIIKK